MSSQGGKYRFEGICSAEACGADCGSPARSQPVGAANSAPSLPRARVLLGALEPKHQFDQLRIPRSDHEPLSATARYTRGPTRRIAGTASPLDRLSPDVTPPHRRCDRRRRSNSPTSSAATAELRLEA
jgi:hypothetical protein